mmetsp:Transcript_580/g.777  ORF Transcript_580/g.777 Transcript_580/m.777 type:complete len:298 (-) Transcript_580:155-1048(-)
MKRVQHSNGNASKLQPPSSSREGGRRSLDENSYSSYSPTASDISLLKRMVLTMGNKPKKRETSPQRTILGGTRKPRAARRKSVCKESKEAELKEALSELKRPPAPPASPASAVISFQALLVQTPKLGMSDTSFTTTTTDPAVKDVLDMFDNSNSKRSCRSSARNSSSRRSTPRNGSNSTKNSCKVSLAARRQLSLTPLSSTRGSVADLRVDNRLTIEKKHFKQKTEEKLHLRLLDKNVANSMICELPDSPKQLTFPSDKTAAVKPSTASEERRRRKLSLHAYNVTQSPSTEEIFGYF